MVFDLTQALQNADEGSYFDQVKEDMLKDLNQENKSSN